MPLTIAEISGKLDAIGLMYDANDERIRLSFRTDAYEDPDGESSLGLTIWLENEGETLRIHAVGCHRLLPSEFPAKLAAVQRTLHQLNWETKLVHYEMDTEDGEIRLSIDVAIEDGTLTDLQLKRLIYVLPNVADRDAVAIREAIDHGIPHVTHEELCRRFDTAMIARDKARR